MGAVCCGGGDVSDEQAKRLSKAQRAGETGRGTVRRTSETAIITAGPNALPANPREKPKKNLVYVVGMGLTTEENAMMDTMYRQKAISSRSLKGPPKASPKDFCQECKRAKATDCICGLTEEQAKKKQAALKMKRSKSSPNMKQGQVNPMDAKKAPIEYDRVDKNTFDATKSPRTPRKPGGSARWGNDPGQKPIYMSKNATPRKKSLA